MCHWESTLVELAYKTLYKMNKAKWITSDIGLCSSPQSEVQAIYEETIYDFFLFVCFVFVYFTFLLQTIVKSFCSI